MPKIIDLNRDALAESLKKLRDSGISYRKMERESGASNVSSLANKSVAATVDNWGKLHSTYPLDIPEPEYSDGRKVFIVGSNNITTTTTAGHNIIDRVSFASPSHQYLHELLNGESEERVKEIIKLVMSGG